MRATVWMLSLVLLWAALHPTVLNAAPLESHRVLLCTQQGMQWVQVQQVSIEVLVDPRNGLAAEDDGHAAMPLLPCPWVNFGQIVPAHDGAERLLSGFLRPYQRLTQHPRSARWQPSMRVRAMAPPCRAPPQA